MWPKQCRSCPGSEGMQFESSSDLRFTCRTLYLWFDSDSWAKSSRLDKLLCLLCHLFVNMMWVFLIIRVCTIYKEMPLSNLAESFALCMGSLLNIVGYIRFAVKRDDVTEIIRRVDEKYLAVPKDDSPNHLAWWRIARKNYIVEGYVLACFQEVPLPCLKPSICWLRGNSILIPRFL